MAGKAILTCKPNSHPFQERTLILEQRVKIGRSVARARAASNNAIFDCKVLSRNHAVFWYENGKFYLQDTKSSNGTFVNNQRLSKTGEESAPREVCSGDIVQFGVDVLENTRKVTHGCIIANLKLFLPDGKEAKPTNSSAVIAAQGTPSVEDLYQLNQYIQESIQREQMIENKLLTLKTVLENIQQAIEQSWKALIAEDRLLSRLEILENQLQTCSKNFPEDKLREELRKLQEDKDHYQNATKDVVKKVLEEKLEATQKCQEVNRSLLSIQAEYSSVCEQVTRSHKDIQELAEKLSSQLAKNDEMETKIQEIGAQHKDTIEKLESRNYELELLLGKQSNEPTSEGDLRIQEPKRIPFKNKSAIQTLSASDDGYIDTSGKNIDVLPEIMEDDHNINNLEEKSKNDEVLDLLCARLKLMHSKNRSKVHQINIEGDWDEYSEKQCEDEKEFPEDEAFEQKTELCEEDIETSSTCTLDFEYRSDEEMGIGQTNNNMDTLKSQSKSMHKEAKVILDPSEDDINVLKVDLDQGNDIINKSCLINEKKSEKAENEFEERQVHTLIDQRNLIANDLFKLQDNQENINWRNHDEEKDALKKQLIEAKQAAKQSRNEAAQLADRLKGLTSELDSRSGTDDNKTKEELDQLKEKCVHLQTAISLLESQNSILKEEYTQLQTEKQSLEEARDKIEKELFTNGSSDVSLQNAEMRTKVSQLEEELAIVGTKYMHCNEERTKLYRELNNLKLDYQAITHQPYFNLIFALPCFILFVAIIIAFYPTLSRLTGTSDHP